MKKQFIERFANLGTKINGVGIFNIHADDGKSNVVGAAFENEGLLKYEYFDHETKESIIAFLKQEDDEYTSSIIIGQTLTMETTEISEEEFNKEVDDLLTLIEYDPNELKRLKRIAD